jgi:isoamylase
MNCATRVGQSSPLGGTIAEGGANFSLFSRSATGVELLFFDNEGDDRPSRVIRIDPAANRTYHYWHLFVSGVESELIYGYRVQGPSDLSGGMRFDRTKILLGVVKFFRLQ